MRSRWVVLFALLLLTLGVVPVLAGTASGDGALSPESELASQEAVPMPSGEELTDATKGIEEKEAQRARENIEIFLDKKTTAGSFVCFSGARTQTPTCGHVVAQSIRSLAGEDNHARGGYWVKFEKPAQPGDSGAPVWRPVCIERTNCSIGLVTARRRGGIETLVEPLLHPPNLATNQVVGILNNKYLTPLSLKLGDG